MPFDFLKPKPKQTVNRYPTDFLLGDLLLKAGIIAQAQLDDAVKLAGNKHMHVGQMLIMAGYISQRDLQAAVDAQSMLRDRAIDQNQAARCLKIACKTGMSFSEVMRDQQEAGNINVTGSTNKLGELLLEAQLINTEQLAKSVQRSMATGLPLGRILVLNGALAENVLTAALEIQVRIRDGMMSRSEGLNGLRVAAGKTDAPVSHDETIRLQNLIGQPRKKGVRLGELLVMAGFLAETDVMNALELGLMNEQPIGQVLVGMGYISDEILNAALELQKRVDEGKIKPQEAADLLAICRDTGRDVFELIQEHEEQHGSHAGVSHSAPIITPQAANAAVPQSSTPHSRDVVADEEEDASPAMPGETASGKHVVAFEKMLTLARVVTEDEIEDALQQAAKSPPVLGRVLHLTGYIDEQSMQAVMQAYTMMCNGFLSQDDAVIALDYCLHKASDHRVTFAEALTELGWSPALPMQMQGAQSVDISQVRLTAMKAPGSEDEDEEDSNGAEEGGVLARLLDEHDDEPINFNKDYSGQRLGEPEPERAPLMPSSRERDDQSDLERLQDRLDGKKGESKKEAAEPVSGDDDSGSVMPLKNLFAEFEDDEKEKEPAKPGEEGGLHSLLDDLEKDVPAKGKGGKSLRGMMSDIEKEPEAEPVDEDEPAARKEEEEEREKEEARKAKEEEEEARKAKEEEAAALKAKEEEEAANKKKEEEAAAARKAKEEEAARKAKEEEIARKEEEDRKEEEARKAREAQEAAEAKEALRKAREAKEAAARKEAEAAKAAEPALVAAGKEEKAKAEPAKSDDDDEKRIQSVLMREFSEISDEPEPTKADDEATRKAQSEGAAKLLDGLAAAVEPADEKKAKEDEPSPAKPEEPSAAKIVEELASLNVEEPADKNNNNNDQGKVEPTAMQLVQELAALREAEGDTAEPAAKDYPSDTPAAKIVEELAALSSDEPAAKAEPEPEPEPPKRRMPPQPVSPEPIDLDNFEGAQESPSDTPSALDDIFAESARATGEFPVFIAEEESLFVDMGEAPKLVAEPAADESAPEEEPVRIVEERIAKVWEEPKEVAPAAMAAEAPAAKAEELQVAKAEEPAAKPAEPVAKAEEPAAKAEEPAAKPAEPAAKAEEPQAKPAEPAAKAEEPQAKPAEPAAKSEEPAAAKAAEPEAKPSSSFWADAMSQANIPVDKLEASAEKILAELKKAEEEPAGAGSAAKGELKAALGTALARLAESYYEQGDYQQAQGLYERILLLKQNELGPRHPSLGAELTNLAGVLCVQGKFAQAEPYVKRVVTIIENSTPLDVIKLADSISTLAGIFFQQGKFEDCEPLLERALKLKQQELGVEHPDIADNLRDFAKVLRKLGRDSEAEKMYAQAKAILSKRPKQQPAASA